MNPPSYILTRLRIHGLIKKVASRYKYYLTKLGRRVLVTALVIRERASEVILGAAGKSFRDTNPTVSSSLVPSSATPTEALASVEYLFDRLRRQHPTRSAHSNIVRASARSIRSR